MISNLTELINTLFIRLGEWSAGAFKWVVSGFFQITQWVANAMLSFAAGIFQYVLQQMPGFSNEDALAAVTLVRDEIAKWNYIFPVYETLVCLNALFTFKIIISARRRFMTILETTVHAKQLLLFKKAGK